MRSVNGQPLALSDSEYVVPRLLSIVTSRRKSVGGLYGSSLRSSIQSHAVLDLGVLSGKLLERTLDGGGLRPTAEKNDSELGPLRTHAALGEKVPELEPCPPGRTVRLVAASRWCAKQALNVSGQEVNGLLHNSTRASRLSREPLGKVVGRRFAKKRLRKRRHASAAPVLR